MRVIVFFLQPNRRLLMSLPYVMGKYPRLAALDPVLFGIDTKYDNGVPPGLGCGYGGAKNDI